MNQYCRYCTNAVYGDFIMCTKDDIGKSLTVEQAKRTNKCKDFEFTPIDLFSGKEYRPRQKTDNRCKNQMKLKF